MKTSFINIAAAIIALFAANFQTYAYHFSVKNSDGVEIRYTVLSEAEKTVEVSGVALSYYSVDVNIPAIIEGMFPAAPSYSPSVTTYSRYTVVSIGSRAFNSYLIRSITMPNTIKTIKQWAINGYGGLTSLKLSNSLETIEGMGIAECNLLTELQLPESLRFIDFDGILNCPKVKSLNIPARLTEIKGIPFDGFDEATEFNVSPYNPVYTSIDGVIYNKAVTTIIRVPGGRQNLLSIPATVETIPYTAFSRCGKLPGVIIPQSVKSISNSAFYGCDGIRMMKVENPDPESIELGSSVFHYSSSRDFLGKSTLYVPLGSRTSYADAEQWNEFATIKEFGNRGDINVDGSVDVNDITTLVNMILGADPDSTTGTGSNTGTGTNKVSDFDIIIADLDADAQITVTDITTLITLLLN